MPDIKLCALDVVNEKCHWFLLPKEQGQEAEYIESTKLHLGELDKGYVFKPAEYTKMEEYADALYDWGIENCE